MSTSAVCSRQYKSHDDPSPFTRKPIPQHDRDRDNRHPQTIAQAELSPGAACRLKQTLSTDQSIPGDREQGGTRVGSGETSTLKKDKPKARKLTEARPPREGGEETSPSTGVIKTPAVITRDCNDEGPMPPDNDAMRSEFHIQELQQQIYSLKQENEDQAKIIAGLRKDLKDEAERCKLIGKSADNMVYALENKDFYIGRQESDDVLYFQFQELVGRIMTWSVPFAHPRPPSHLDFTTQVMDEFGKVAPGVTDFPLFLQTPKNLRLFICGYVGLVLADMIFRAWPSGTRPGSRGEDVWMDKNLAHGVFLVESRLSNADRTSISLREFHDWRALTTTLISKSDDASSKTNESVDACITKCRNRIMDVIGMWVTEKDRREVEEPLSVVLLKAIRLSQGLRCQRAHWSVRYPGAINQRVQSELSDDLVFFDQATMDDRYGDENSDEEDSRTGNGKIVEVFVTPSLFKSGNSDGERFDVESCVQRSEVKCRTLNYLSGRL